MKNRIVNVPQMKSLVKKAPGFTKKELATYKLDILALCGFGCRYCSSNTGNYLRINAKKFSTCVEKQFGKAGNHIDDSSLTYVYPDVVNQLKNELIQKSKSFGAGHTLMFSMLTDGFSPSIVEDGTTKAVLELVLRMTSFRIRVLTKNAIVGSKEWVQFFAEHRDRFVIGLSTGSLDDDWSRKMEVGTSPPSDRFAALANLQAAGVPTFGMLCPVFPDMLEDRLIEKMIELINPELVEHIWAEPYNSRANWKVVRDSFVPGSQAYEWFTNVYGHKWTYLWSRYATDLYRRMHRSALMGGWVHKIRYLLYEDKITAADSLQFHGLEGVLLQSKPGDDGCSQNPNIAKLQ
jgi:DNA repair photolyase